MLSSFQKKSYIIYYVIMKFIMTDGCPIKTHNSYVESVFDKKKWTRYVDYIKYKLI